VAHQQEGAALGGDGVVVLDDKVDGEAAMGSDCWYTVAQGGITGVLEFRSRLHPRKKEGGFGPGSWESKRKNRKGRMHAHQWRRQQGRRLEVMENAVGVGEQMGTREGAGARWPTREEGHVFQLRG
jgi:hypothetical protein